MTTNSVSRCQPQPCPLLTWYTKQILCHYLLLRNKTPRMILKNWARGRLENGKCLWKSVCVAAGVHSPPMSPARLSCHLSPWSYIVLSANLYNLNKRKEKVAAALNQYFRNQKQPCAEQTQIVLLVSPWSGSPHHSVLQFIFSYCLHSQGRLWLNAEYFVNASTNIYI